MMNIATRTIIIGAMFLSSGTFAAEHDFELTLISDLQYFDSIYESGIEAQAQEEVLLARADLFWNGYFYPSENISMEVRYGLSNQNQLLPENVLTNTLGSSELADYRVADVQSTVLESDGGRFQLIQQLDVLLLNFYSSVGTWSIGRQPISFGVASVFSPVDIVQPVGLLATDSEYRPGVDAVRGNWFLGAVSELEAGWVFGEDSLYFVRMKTFQLGSDWEVTAIQLNDEASLLGVGAVGSLGDIGIIQETAFLTSDDSEGVRSTLGVNGRLLDDWLWSGELHFNGVGQPDNYSENYEKVFYQLGAVVPQANWYFSATASYQLTPLSTLSFNNTVNLNEGSSLFSSSLFLSTGDNSSLQAAGYVPLAERSLQSEYGVYPYSLRVEWDWLF